MGNIGKEMLTAARLAEGSDVVPESMALVVCYYANNRDITSLYFPSFSTTCRITSLDPGDTDVVTEGVLLEHPFLFLLEYAHDNGEVTAGIVEKDNTYVKELMDSGELSSDPLIEALLAEAVPQTPVK